MPATAGIDSRPAVAGDILSIYCTGLGSTSPAVATGVPAPFSPLARVRTDVTVTLGGLPAPVSFAGLTPGLIGFYQINATVPAGITPGDTVPVVVSQNGASGTATIAVH